MLGTKGETDGHIRTEHQGRFEVGMMTIWTGSSAAIGRLSRRIACQFKMLHQRIYKNMHSGAIIDDA